MTTESKSKGNRGKYVATPVSVTFPATFPNADYAGKTMTYAGRGRKPTWWALAEETGLVAAKETAAPAAVKTVDAVVDGASGPQG